jgi:hypothetical protein
VTYLSSQKLESLINILNMLQDLRIIGPYQLHKKQTIDMDDRLLHTRSGIVIHSGWSISYELIQIKLLD